MLTTYTSGIGYVNAQQAARLADNEGQGGQESEKRESSDKRRRLLVQQVREKEKKKKKERRASTAASSSCRAAACVAAESNSVQQRVAQQRVSHAAHARHAICACTLGAASAHARMQMPHQKKYSSVVWRLQRASKGVLLNVTFFFF
jgi:hypothetical protein